MSGLTGKQLKYGPVMGLDHPGYPVGIDASQSFPAQSGRFVTINTGNGFAAISISTSTLIFGWADVGSLANDSTSPYVSSSTAGNDVASVITASDCVFRLPISAGTFAQTNVGLAYDLTVATIGGVANAQGVSLSATTRKLVIVVGGDLANNEWIDVIMSPDKRHS